jgi:heme-degrading monooxygenase HmoA
VVVVVNRLAVAEERQKAVVAEFAAHAGDLRAAPGCLGFELWRAEAGELWAVSRWQSRTSYEAWRSSEGFARAHGGASSAPLHAAGEERSAEQGALLLERLLPAGP